MSWILLIASLIYIFNIKKNEKVLKSHISFLEKEKYKLMKLYLENIQN